MQAETDTTMMTLPPEKSNISGLILAGGRGTRMGTVDKGLQLFRGIHMIEHVIQGLTPQVNELIINANQNIEQYAAFGLPVYSDELTGYAGPLAGMEVGLRHCTTPYLVTAPCDTPFLPDNLVECLSQSLLQKQADIAVAVTGIPAHYQAHSVFCLIKTSLLPHLEAFLKTGQRKIDAWYASLEVAHTYFSNEQSFRNINTLEELQYFESTDGDKV